MSGVASSPGALLGKPQIQDRDLESEVTADLEHGIIRISYRFVDEVEPGRKATVEITMDHREGARHAEKLLNALVELNRARASRASRRAGGGQ